MKNFPRCVPQSSHTHCFSRGFLSKTYYLLITLFSALQDSALPYIHSFELANTFLPFRSFASIMMLLDLTSLLLAASLASGASIPLGLSDVLYTRQDSGDPGLQDIPPTGKADNTFSNGLPDSANFPSSDATPPAVYGNRTIDLPFGRLYVRKPQILYSNNFDYDFSIKI